MLTFKKACYGTSSSHPRNVNGSTRPGFSAWTEPGLMSQWLFKSPDNLIVIAEQDFRVGGRYSIMETTATNEKIDHFGTYLTIVPSTELSFTLEVPWHFSGITTVVIHLMDGDHGNCVMDFWQRGVDPKIVEDNWKVMFNNLRTIL